MKASQIISAACLVASASSQDCPAVKILVARASGESPGTGIIGAVAQDIAAQVQGSSVDIEALDYPAQVIGYFRSEPQGTEEMVRVASDFASSCPGSRMVMMGYSQGAQVVMDALCGTSSRGFPESDPLPAEVTDKVVAVVAMGDPSFTPDETFAAGTAEGSGVFPRRDAASCNAVADKTISICNDNDEFCDSGRSLRVHVSYVETDGDDAVAFAVSKINGS